MGVHQRSAWCWSAAYLVVLGWSAIATHNAAAQALQPRSTEASVLPPGITLGMTMRQAVRACRAQGSAVTLFYDGEGGQEASVPLGTPAPQGRSLGLQWSGLKCEGTAGELWISLAPSSVRPRFEVTEARGYVTVSGLGMPAHDYARQLTLRHGPPVLDMRSPARPRRRPTLEWVVPRLGKACGDSQPNGQCVSRLALTFLAAFNNRDEVSIGFELSVADSEEPGRENEDALSLLGVQLGSQLSIPECGVAETSVLLASGVPCFPREAELDGPWDVRNYRPSHEIFLGDSRASVRGVNLAIASLAAEHCPPWLDRECLLSIPIVDGRVAGLGFRTAQLSEAQLREHVSQWMGAEMSTPAEQAEVQCQHSEEPFPPPVTGTRRRWTNGALSVEYTSVSGPTCSAGLVRIQTTPLAEALTRSVPAPR